MWRTRRGGSRTPSTTTDANLNCAFVENALFLHLSLILKSQQNRIELVTRPVTKVDGSEHVDQRAESFEKGLLLFGKVCPSASVAPSN